MSFFDELSDHFYELHTDCINAIEGLSSDALDWTVCPEMNSITVLVTHLTGAEYYWIGVALNEPPERDREAEFRTRGSSAEELKRKLVSADIYIQKVMLHFSVPDLEDVHLSPRNDKRFSTGWCLAHALKHTALHTGHIQLMRQLWEQRGEA